MASISLRTTVRLATIGAAAGCLLIIAGVAAAYSLLGRAEGHVAFANGLISDAGKLNLLTAELMIQRSERAAWQWNALHESFVRRIQTAPPIDGRSTVTLNEIAERLRSVRGLVVRMHQIVAPGDSLRPGAGEVSEILLSAIIGQSHAVLERSRELHEVMTLSATNARRYVLTSLGVAFLIVAIGGGIALLLLSKSMLAHILRLRGTIQTLGQGDLDIEIPHGVPNEVGDVFSELDRMRRNLLASMSELSRANLELVSIQGKLEDRTTSLEAVNRELESFTSAVSHDLRAPLRTVIGFSDAITEDFGAALGKDGRDMLGRISRAARQMYVLIEDLLRLSRLGRETLHVKPTDLSAHAQDLCRIIAERHPEHPVKVTVAPGMTACCDERLMRIALGNLLENAWKFTAGKPAPQVEIGCEQSNGETQFFVQDNGAGFDMSFSHNLFKPFKRLHAAAEFSGTGIGLATVARIVELHGGSISAAAYPGEGARFTFRFARPAAAAGPDEAETDQPAPVQALKRAAGGQ
jgi:signal transduction histidine kinase